VKIRVGVDAGRSRLGTMTIGDGPATSSAIDVCATGETASGNAPFGKYVLKEARPVQGALVAELGDTTLVFEPLSGAARLAESLGRFVLEVHAGRAGSDGRLRTTSRGLRMWPDTLARLASAAANGERIELEIYEAPLTLWDRIFFCRRRYSRGFDASATTRDYDDDSRSYGTTGSSSSSSNDSGFTGKGGTFGGAGASGSWDGASTAAAVATGAALGASVAAASESASSSEAHMSSGIDDAAGSDDAAGADDDRGDAGTSY
jgi:hypothetical protein